MYVRTYVRTYICIVDPSKTRHSIEIGVSAFLRTLTFVLCRLIVGVVLLNIVVAVLLDEFINTGLLPSLPPSPPPLCHAILYISLWDTLSLPASSLLVGRSRSHL